MTEREYILSRVEVSDATGCWVWRRAVTRYGYGQANMRRDGKRTHRTHRLAYEVFVGPVPPGLELDHLCRNRLCCNPAHLEPVVHRENVARGASKSATAARSGRCKHGHELVGGNVYLTRSGTRRCVACNGERQAVYRARKRAAAPPPVHPNARKTHCLNGHPFDGSNTYVDRSGKRHCRACCAARMSAGRARKKAPECAA